MAATVTTHTLDANWTPSGLRDLFRSSFIANGTMTDWHDTVTFGDNQTGVLEKVWDGSKTYGTTYYLFRFTANAVYVSQCDGWSLANNTPNGAIHDSYVPSDFSSTSQTFGEFKLVPNGETNQNYGHGGSVLEAGTSVVLKCYTSGVNSDFKLFVLQSGEYSSIFMLPIAPASNIDLDHFMYGGVYSAVRHPESNRYAALNFSYISNGPRRMFPGNIYGTTDSASYIQQAYNFGHTTMTYEIPASTSFPLDNSSTGSPSGRATTKLPTLNAGIIDANAPATNKYYIHTNLFFSFYEAQSNLPSDFGIYGANGSVQNFSLGDKLIVTAGIEEYDIITASPSSSSSDGTYAYAAFVIRTV